MVSNLKKLKDRHETTATYINPIFVTEPLPQTFKKGVPHTLTFRKLLRERRKKRRKPGRKRGKGQGYLSDLVGRSLDF